MSIPNGADLRDKVLREIAAVAENPENFTAADIQWAKNWVNSLRRARGLSDLRNYTGLMNFMTNN